MLDGTGAGVRKDYGQHRKQPARSEAAHRRCLRRERATRANDVTLLAVSKTFGEAAVREAHAAGQRAFGENYVQEALAKIEALADLRGELVWHLIGPLQSNKTRAVAAAFDWVHTVDRLKIAQRLSEQRPAGMPPLNICLQVNVSGEASKSGVTLAELPALAQRGGRPAEADPARLDVDTRAGAGQRRAARAAPRAGRGTERAQRIEGLALDTLSMGMSADLEAAVAEGATIVRIGTAIFGGR